MSLWELRAAVAGFWKANSTESESEDNSKPPSAAEFFQAVASSQVH